MRCDEFSADVEALISEELDGSTATEMREHAESCADCARLLQSSSAAADALKRLGVHSMPASVESRIRSALKDSTVSARRPMIRLSRRALAFAGALATLLVALGLFLMRQGPVTAGQIIAQAESRLKGIASYHVKYKMTLGQRGGRRDVAYSEMWYKAPSALRSVLTQAGSVWVDLAKGQARWWYIEGSDAAFVIPMSDEERTMLAEGLFKGRSLGDMLKEFGEGYTYAGTERVGKWQCDVIQGTFEDGDIEVRASIDRETGALVKYSRREKNGFSSGYDLETLEVNEPISGDLFDLQLPNDVLLVKAPAMDSFLLNVSLYSRDNDYSSPPMDPSELTQILKSIAEQGAVHSAPLRDLYEPGYVPSGYALLGASHGGEDYKTPDGMQGNDLTKGFKAISITYLNPRTGDTISLWESSDAIAGSEDGREVSLAGFDGRVKHHSTPFPYVVLFWKQDDVHFRLSASSLAEKEAIKIARSMCLLGTAPAARSGAAPELQVPLQTGMWRITLLAQGTTSETVIQQTAEQVRKRLINRGFTGARVRVVPTGRIEVTAYGVGDKLRQAIILPDDLPARLRDYAMDKLW